MHNSCFILVHLVFQNIMPYNKSGKLRSEETKADDMAFVTIVASEPKAMKVFFPKT